MAKYLGLDLSTQSFSAIIIDTMSDKIILEESISFSKDLAEYKCENGYLKDKNPLVAHCDPLLWVAGLELLLQKIKANGFDLSQIDGLSGSAQQHGTVYLNHKFADCASFEFGNSLVDFVSSMLTRKSSPIWMDSSTQKQCQEITESLGGSSVVQQKSGSPTIERFAGPQIRKFYQEDSCAYQATGVIHLISSFMASLLCGKSVGVDYADASGMNLFNIINSKWDSDLVNASAGNLADKLPNLIKSDSVVGCLSDYFSKVYGFKKNIPVVAWSGDNPNSIVGVGASTPEYAVISMGTSDTFFASMDNFTVDSSGYGHVFANPAGDYMCLICFKNGSLARENIKNEFKLDWNDFDNTAFKETSIGNNSNIMLPFYVPEITPLILKKHVEFIGDDDFVNRKSPYKAVRAIVEGQVMNMKINSSWIGLDKLKVIRVTGGASKSDGICQVIADIFQVSVERLKVSNSASLGSAIRAVHALTNESWDSLREKFSLVEEKVFYANKETVELYDKNIEIFKNALKKINKS